MKTDLQDVIMKFNDMDVNRDQKIDVQEAAKYLNHVPGSLGQVLLQGVSEKFDSLSCCCCVNKRKMATSFLKAIGDKINICDTGPHWTYTQNLSQTNHFFWPKGVVYAISPILWCPHVWYLKKRL